MSNPPPLAALLGPGRLESRFEDLKPAYTEAEAVAEANRCIFCHDAPCIRACPTAIDIPQFIRKIATGNYRGSAKTIFDSNILGMSCARVCPVEVLCVGACVYNEWGREPIRIGRLQRFATDRLYEKGTRLYRAGEPTGFKVALVGGGPASLACAHELRLLGHAATIFEKDALPGGLNTDGVAPYKMRAEASLAEVEFCLQVGVEMKTGVAVGADVALDDLLRDHDAVFLGVGLGDDGRLGIAGEDLDGVYGACKLIERIKVEGGFSLDGTRAAVVIGGGNTAIDVVRELRGLGVPSVTLVYRRSDAEIPAYRHEVAYARKEGARFELLASPVAFVGDGGGRLRAVRLQRMELGPPDASGRRRPVPVDGAIFDLPCEIAAIGIGQNPLRELFAKVEGLRIEGSRVVVDPATGRTGNPKVFAGGDCANGGAEVVNAAAEGKRAARGIDAYLKSLAPTGV